MATDPAFTAGMVITGLLLLFLLYYLIRKHNIISELMFSPGRNPVIAYFSEKLIGFVLFGIVPFLVFIVLSGFFSSESVMTFGTSFHFLYILLPLLLIVLVLTFSSSGRKAMQARYPQLRIKLWTVSDILISVSGWIIYLLGYEFFFRGILWIACYSAFGFWPALIINTILYAIVHLDQGATMSLGTIPVGIVFCLLTFLTGSFFPAFLIHSFMAVSTELFSIYNNPDIGVRLKLKGSVS
jgi:membrane protease YdiL (CAAX protease family)